MTDQDKKMEKKLNINTIVLMVLLGGGGTGLGTLINSGIDPDKYQELQNQNIELRIEKVGLEKDVKYLERELDSKCP